MTNQGLIQADVGNVVLAGASAFTVDFTGDNLLRFAITAPVEKSTGKPALVSNSGTISAAGGKVLMTARAASNVVDNVVNNTGMIQATSVSEKNGVIVLDAGDGTAIAGGTMDASGSKSGETGGTVEVLGKNVQVADGTTINASGSAGGGLGPDRRQFPRRGHGAQRRHHHGRPGDDQGRCHGKGKRRQRRGVVERQDRIRRIDQRARRRQRRQWRADRNLGRHAARRFQRDDQRLGGSRQGGLLAARSQEHHGVRRRFEL